MAVTEEDCVAMIGTAREHGVKLMIAYRLHFDPANTNAIERVRNGDIGEPRIVSSVFSHQVRAGNIRTRGDLGGGALLDLGIYCINAARYLFREEPIEVFAQQILGTDERSETVDETTTAILRFPRDRIAQFTASQGAADVAILHVVGTEGDLRLDGAYEYADETEQRVVIDGKSETKSFGKRDQFAPELIHFSDCILNDEEPEPSGFEGLADVRIMEAMRESARTGLKVAVPPIHVPRRPDETIAMTKPPTKQVETVHAPSPSK
jgi:predicted dehydrogenase